MKTMILMAAVLLLGFVSGLDVADAGTVLPMGSYTCTGDESIGFSPSSQTCTAAVVAGPTGYNGLYFGPEGETGVYWGLPDTQGNYERTTSKGYWRLSFDDEDGTWVMYFRKKLTQPWVEFRGGDYA